MKPGQLIKPGAPLVKIQDRPADAPGENEITARTIFDALDIDRSGRLEVDELVAVLVSWGVQRLEAENVVTSIRNQRLTAEDRERNFVYWEHPKTGELEFKEEWERRIIIGHLIWETISLVVKTTQTQEYHQELLDLAHKGNLQGHVYIIITRYLQIDQVEFLIWMEEFKLKESHKEFKSHQVKLISWSEIVKD